MRDLSHVPEAQLEATMPDGRTWRQHLQQREAQRRAHEGTNSIPLSPAYGHPITFGDDATRAAHDRRCRQRALAMVGHRWEVAPLHLLTLPSGHRLRAGDVVRPEHFIHEDEPRHPVPIIERLVRLGVVIESAVFTGDDEGPQAA